MEVTIRWGQKRLGYRLTVGPVQEEEELEREVRLGKRARAAGQYREMDGNTQTLRIVKEALWGRVRRHLLSC